MDNEGKGEKKRAPSSVCNPDSGLRRDCGALNLICGLVGDPERLDTHAKIFEQQESGERGAGTRPSNVIIRYSLGAYS